MDKYELILAVYEEGNITKAAKKLNYSQSAVSQAILCFEKELGIQIFERSKAGVKILPPGEHIMASLKLIENEKEKIRQVAEAVKEISSGTIKVGCISSIMANWFPQILGEFTRLYPQIKFELYVGAFDYLRSLLENEEIDFAFMSQLSAKGFEFITLIKDEMMIVLSQQHELSEQISVSIADIDVKDIIISSEGLDYEIGDIIKCNGINVEESKYYVNDDLSVVKLIECGFGISIIPQFFCVLCQQMYVFGQ